MAFLYFNNKFEIVSYINRWKNHSSPSFTNKIISVYFHYVIICNESCEERCSHYSCIVSCDPITCDV
jgi:hypothetical protein